MAERRHFNKDIRSYDAHIYYFGNYEPSRKEAYGLREALIKEFTAEIDNGDLRVYQMHDIPIGPHATAMWECDFATPEMFSKIVPW